MTFARVRPRALADLAGPGICDRHGARRFARQAGGSANDWTPAVDIVEEDSRFVIRADVPGVEPADIDVSMDDDILSISGQRDTTGGGDTASGRRIERCTGRFARRFRLSDSVDVANITARCNHGMLEVVIPKAPVSPARRITVQAA